MSKLLKSQAVGLPETKNQQRRTFDESKESKKIRKSNNEEGGDKQKQVRLIIDIEKQDPFQL